MQVVQTDMAAGSELLPVAGKNGFGEAGAVVVDGDLQRFQARVGGDGDMNQHAVIAEERVFERIPNERLHHEQRHRAGRVLRRTVDFHREAVFIPHPLDGQIVVDMLDFVREQHHLRDGAHGVAEIIRQRHDHIADGGVILHLREAVDDVEVVDEKMRGQLQL